METLTKKQAQNVAVLYQAMFIGELAAIRCDRLINLVKNTAEYRRNFKNIRKYIYQLENCIKRFEYAQFKGKAKIMRKKYIDLATPIFTDEFIMQMVIKNTLNYYFVENSEIVSAHIQVWLLSTLSKNIIEDMGIGNIAKYIGFDGQNCGISTIRKLSNDIIGCFCQKLPDQCSFHKIAEAYQAFDNKFSQNSELLLQILEVNGIKTTKVNE